MSNGSLVQTVKRIGPRQLPCGTPFFSGKKVETSPFTATRCEISAKYDAIKLLNFLRTLDFSQLIKEPTRVTDKSRTLIDVILVNNEHRIVDSGVVPVSLSDHFLIFCVLKTGVRLNVLYLQRKPPRNGYLLRLSQSFRHH